MPALNFQKQFADAVEGREKTQTIRALRKDGRDPKPGDTLYLYTGMRTKACRKLGEVVCAETMPILISSHGNIFSDGVEFGPRQRQSFARDDGFRDGFGEMVAWFKKTHGLPFKGLLIKWEAS